MFVLIRQNEAYIHFGMKIVLYCFDQKCRFFFRARGGTPWYHF